MLFSTFAAMLLIGAAPAAIRVDVGKINLHSLPEAKRVGRQIPTPAMVEKVEEFLAGDKCRVEGQSSSRFDFDVPYAVLLEPDGQAARVVVSELGCPDLETYSGLVVLELARLGDFRATGEKKARWFAGKLNFNLQ